MTNIFEFWYLGLAAIIVASFANLIGAQIGSRISARASKELLKKILTLAFLLLGLSNLLLKILR